MKIFFHNIVQQAGRGIGCEADPQVSHSPWEITGRGVPGRNGMLDIPQHRGDVWVGELFHDLERGLLCTNIVLAVVLLNLFGKVIQDFLLQFIPIVP